MATALSSEWEANGLGESSIGLTSVRPVTPHAEAEARGQQLSFGLYAKVPEYSEQYSSATTYLPGQAIHTRLLP